MSAQKNDSLDLACRAEHGATVSAVQYARWILPGKEQGVELGQEGDSWNVGQGLLEDVRVLCQGQQGRAAALDGCWHQEPARVAVSRTVAMGRPVQCAKSVRVAGANVRR